MTFGALGAQRGSATSNFWPLQRTTNSRKRNRPDRGSTPGLPSSRKARCRYANPAGNEEESSTPTPTTLAHGAWYASGTLQRLSCFRRRSYLLQRRRCGTLKTHLYTSPICPKGTRNGAHMSSNAYISNGKKCQRMLKKTKLSTKDKVFAPDSDSDPQSASHSIAPRLIPAQASPTPTSPGRNRIRADILNGIPDKVDGGGTVVNRDSKRLLYVDRCVRD